MSNDQDEQTGLELAVIGMAGKFPGAGDINEFWDNLVNGVESITFFSDEELQEAGVDPGLLEDPAYVKTAGGLLQDKEYFDAAFFGYTHREAEITDPQLRVFLHCLWQALEDAGYDPFSYDGSVGLYAGASANFHWEALGALSGKSTQIGQYAAGYLTDKDFLATTAAFKLNLKGPCVTMQTACSTSLVAVHLAAQAILNGECDMALAGGVTVALPISGGYLYKEGMIYSPDGHCRAFDARARGCIGGSGTGVVVLKSLENALDDSDHIYAVIKSTAVNNDGSRKAGFTAPALAGQAQVIRIAHQVAGVEADSIGYVETHGTGTPLGDPIEIEALKKAFAGTNRKGFCALGSVKTNVGHLDSASGVTSLIKTVLAIYHQQIPPSLFFQTPNPKIDFTNSPFYVNTSLKEWSQGEYPRRAGVSSFGIGGTNVHVILEEAPVDIRDKEGTRGLAPLSNRQYQLILLSAKTLTALDRMTQNLLGYFKKNLSNHGNHENPVKPGQNPGLNIADAAYTLQVGRKAFAYRRMLVCSNNAEASNILASGDADSLDTAFTALENRPLVFMFPGQGSQYVEMGLDLYRGEPVFAEAADRCFNILKTIIDIDIKDILYPARQGDRETGATAASMSTVTEQPINRTAITQPAVFVIEYALAKLLMSWGISPYAMIGHSIGEFTAAHLAGVFTLEEALTLIAARGEFMQQMTPGSMLSVPLSEDELMQLLKAENSQLAVAAINSSAHCVVSGSHDKIELFAEQLQAKGIKCKTLHTSHAFHSHMMDTAAARFEAEVSKITLKPPEIPYISNVTGTWITVEDAVSPAYWAAQARHTVRFSDGLQELLKKEHSLFLEVGPGRVLSTFVRQHKDKNKEHVVIDLLRHPRENVPDDTYLLLTSFKSLQKKQAFEMTPPKERHLADREWGAGATRLLKKIGKLWLSGYTPDWSGFHAPWKRRRIPLPTYSFDYQRYWIDSDLRTFAQSMTGAAPGAGKKPGEPRFYVPLWQETLPGLSAAAVEPGEKPWLIFADTCGVGAGLRKKLQQENLQAILVTAGPDFQKTEDNDYIINPDCFEHYEKLFKELRQQERSPAGAVHMWSISRGSPDELTPGAFDTLQETGFYSLLYLARAAEQQNMDGGFQIAAVANGLWEVLGDESLSPGKATMLGLFKVIPQEFPGISCRSIDIVLPQPGTQHEEILTEQLAAELRLEAPGAVIAYRHKRRWSQQFKPVELAEEIEKRTLLQQEGVYLISGGTGKIGMVLAEFLARQYRARLILTSRNDFPAREEWDQWAAAYGADHPVNRKITKIKELEAAGSEIMIAAADAADPQQMHRLVMDAEKRFGTIHGVIHAAGITGEHSAHCTVRQLTRQDCLEQFRPKVYGMLVLAEIFKDKQTDFILTMSSLAALLGGIGFAAYAAANAFMDAFVQQQNHDGRQQWLTVNWDGWQFPEKTKTGKGAAITPAAGQTALQRILARAGKHQVAVSIGNLQSRIHRWVTSRALPEEASTKEQDNQKMYARPELQSTYTAPANRLEQDIASIWQAFFGLEKVGVNDDFFELGGDSLKMTTIISRVHKELAVEIPLAAFFAAPTVKGLAHFVEEAKQSEFTSITPAEKREFYLLSSTQRRLFILQQMSPQSTGYNETSIIPWHEDPETVEKADAAFNQLILRHESLRTSFEMIGDEPVQVIHDRIDFGMENYETGPGEENIKGILENFIRPFDLGKPPLFRVALVKSSRTRALLVLDMHHIVTDGLSMNILINEFGALYSNEPSPPLRIQYKDYSQWQRRQYEREDTDLKQKEAFWMKQFEGEIPVLHLPYDYARPPVQSFEGHTVPFVLNKEETVALRQMALDHGATMYIVLLTILNIWIFRLSSQEDIALGTPVAGRRHEDLKHIIGMFVNTLVMRNFPKGQKTALAFLEEVKERTVKAFENQDYPFEELVNKVEVKRDTARNPLFDMMFSFLDLEVPPEQRTVHPRSEEKESPQGFENSAAKFDLTLYCMDMGDHLRFAAEYCTRLFEEKTIQRLIRYFKEITASVIKYPTRALIDMELIPTDEKKQILEEFNDTVAAYPGDKTIHELFAEQTKRNPACTVLIGTPQNAQSTKMHLEGTRGLAPLSGLITITYSELNKQSNRLAFHLKEKGVHADEIVAIMVGRSLAMIIGIMAILKAGGAYLPIDPQYPQERISYMLTDSKTKVLLASPETLVKVKTGVEDRCGQPQELHLEFINIETNLASTLEPSPSTLTSTSTCQVSPPNLAYVIYTSGSTGKPKGIMIEHKSVINFIKGITLIILFTANDRILSLTTISFDIFGLETLVPLTMGSVVVIGSRNEQIDTSAAARVMKKERVNILQVTPSRLQAFIYDDGAIRGLGNLNYLLVGGEAFPEMLLEKVKPLIGGRIFNMYGPTETTIWSTVKELTGQESLNIGKPIANTQIYIVNKVLKLQPVGVAGELAIGGLGLARGYLNQPELTKDKFLFNFYRSYMNYISKKFYQTGDLARWLPDGNIEFLGRIDYQVKIRGFRVEPGEIEALLLKHEEVENAAVIPRQDPNNLVYLCGFIVARGELDVPSLKDWLSGQLPAYMIPAYFVAVNEIPLTHHGKVDRNVLLQLDIAGETPDKYKPPRNEIEKQLIAIWRELLNIDHIGIDYNFFDIGGNSMTSILMASKIFKHFNIEVPVSFIFKDPRIEEISKYILNTKYIKEEEDPYILLNQSASKKLFLFPPGTGYGMAYKEFSSFFSDYSFYAFNFIVADNRIEKYIRTIMAIQAEGPYILFGWSAGGNLAFKIAREFEKKGHEISAIILLDAFRGKAKLEPWELERNRKIVEKELKKIEKELEFLGLDSLKHNVLEKIRKYQNYYPDLLNIKISADIHLILAEEKEEKQAKKIPWDNATSGKVITYRGFGGHEDMLNKQNLEKNAQLTREILTRLTAK